MNKIRKIGALLGIKGLLSIASLTTIALALVVYTASVTMNPTAQFTIGAQTDTWTVYINEVNQVRYLPGGSSEPTLNTGDTSTFAFRVVTDADKVCAVGIGLRTAMDSGKFSNFDITVSYWDGSAWVAATLYDSNTGSTTMTSINGTASGAIGYIHQGVSDDNYYLVEVVYSYDLVADTTQITALFDYTPLAQASF